MKVKHCPCCGENVNEGGSDFVKGRCSDCKVALAEGPAPEDLDTANCCHVDYGEPLGF